MADEVTRLFKINNYVNKQWEELNEICKNNEPPNIPMHIPFEIIIRIKKMEKSLRITNKLIEKIIDRLYITENISTNEKENMLKKLEYMREETVKQQWSIFDIENTMLKRQRDND